MIEFWAVPILAGIFGLLFGSFLNVCALRWGNPEKKSVVFPASHCPKCQEPLRWYDNVPVVSWALLRGACRYCSAPISMQYPLVELTTGLIWAGAFATYGLEGESVRGALFLTILLGITVSDARFYIIPHEFTIGGGALGVALAFLPGGLTWTDALIGSAVGYSVFFAVGWGSTAIIKKVAPERLEEMGVDQALGGGDIWMMMMIGSFVGIWGVALTIFLGSTIALVVFGVISAVTRKPAPLVPFGVFLAAGGGVAYAFGAQIVSWYLTFVGF